MRLVPLLESASVALLLGGWSVAAQECDALLHKASCTSLQTTTQVQCQNLGCCWDATDNSCYYPAVSGYAVCMGSDCDAKRTGSAQFWSVADCVSQYEATPANPGKKVGQLTLRSPSHGPFGDDIPNLDVKGLFP